jgi:NAD(P)-dependent dehydrogenase (short-subunit alcohol dehydrogenase family)
MTPLAKRRSDRAARLPKNDRPSPVRRAGTPDEVGNGAALLMGPDGAFITGSDFVMDGGVTAAYWYGATKYKSET